LVLTEYPVISQNLLVKLLTCAKLMLDPMHLARSGLYHLLAVQREVIALFATVQDLEEPGEDTSKYDVMAPTVVHPKRTSTVHKTYENAEVTMIEHSFLQVVNDTVSAFGRQRKCALDRRLSSFNTLLFQAGQRLQRLAC
jgi:hypothetical protein